MHLCFALDQMFHLLSVFFLYFFGIRHNPWDKIATYWKHHFLPATLLIKKREILYTTHSYLLFCNSTHLSIQDSLTEYLHKPVTAALYHLIGPWWERHLNMQIIQKPWINFTHKCLKSLALLLKEFSISSAAAKKRSQKFSMWGERDTGYVNDSGVLIDSPATWYKSEIK